MLLPSWLGLGLVHIAIFVGVNVVAVLRDAVAGVRVVSEAMCPADRLAGVGVAGGSRRATLHHAGVLVVGAARARGIVAGVGVACPAVTGIRFPVDGLYPLTCDPVRSVPVYAL